LLIKAFW